MTLIALLLFIWHTIWPDSKFAEWPDIYDWSWTTSSHHALRMLQWNSISKVKSMENP